MSLPDAGLAITPTRPCAAITLGDYVSAYLGLLYGIDPSATPALTLVKTRMSEFGKVDEENESGKGDDFDAD